MNLELKLCVQQQAKVQKQECIYRTIDNVTQNRKCLNSVYYTRILTACYVISGQA